MAVRARPINWSLLLNPAMAGIAEEAQASSNFGRTLSGAGADVGGALVRSRQEKESKRRFGEELSLRKENLSLEREGLNLRREQMLDEQAATTERLDATSESIDRIQQEAATLGQPSPETQKAVSLLVDAGGGPQKVQEELAKRTTPWHDRYTEIPAHKRIAGDPDFDKFMSEYSASGASMSPLNVDAGDLAGGDAGGVVQREYNPQRPTPPAAGKPMLAEPMAPPPGEMGLPDGPADALYARVEKLDELRQQAKAEMEEARAILNSSSLHGSARRAKARLDYNRALGVWSGLNSGYAADLRRASQAQQRETSAEIERRQKAVKFAEDEKLGPARVAMMVEKGYLSPERAQGLEPAEAEVLWEDFDIKRKTGEAIAKEGVRQGNRVALQEDRQRFTEEQQERSFAHQDTARREVADIRAKAATPAEARRAVESRIRDQKGVMDTHWREYQGLAAAVKNEAPNADPEAVRSAWAQYQDARDKYEAMTRASEDPGAGAGEAEAPAAPATTGGQYPSWLVNTPTAKAAWAALTPEQKQEQIGKRGR